MSPRIAFVTCDEHPALYAEERELPARAAARGFDVAVHSWSDPSVEWRRFERVILRSTWDYPARIDAFHRWLDALDAAAVPLVNPTSLVRWNVDKRYLADLASRGARTVPTRYVDAGERFDLAAWMDASGLDVAVVKPTISGGAYRTHRVARADAARFQRELDLLAADLGAMVQPYLREIERDGEWSLLHFGGVFSHAVVKRPRAGDFRVQTELGGWFEKAEPPASLVAEAGAVLALAPEAPRYARVDGVIVDGHFQLVELEAIEPYLFLAATTPDRADAYLDAVLVEREPA